MRPPIALDRLPSSPPRDASVAAARARRFVLPLIASLVLHAAVVGALLSAGRVARPRERVVVGIELVEVGPPPAPAGSSGRAAAGSGRPSAATAPASPERAGAPRPDRRRQGPIAARAGSPVAPAPLSASAGGSPLSDGPGPAEVASAPGDPAVPAAATRGELGADDAMSGGGDGRGVAEGAGSRSAGAGRFAGGSGAGGGGGSGPPLDAIRDQIARAVLYPPAARRNRLQGRVVVTFTIRRDGRAQDVRVVASSGYDLLDRSAVSAVLSAGPFRTGEREASITTPILFRLE